MAIEWIDADQVGMMLGYKGRVIREKVAKRDGFPPPLRAYEGAHPRWRRDEIERWAERVRASQVALLSPTP